MTPATTRRRRPGREYARLRGLRREQRERRQRQDPVQARHRHLDVHRDVRSRAVPLDGRAALRRGRLGARHHPDAPDGQVEVITGTSPHGQGHETSWSQIVADRLGVPFEDVEVLHGDTAIATRGLDTYGSRSLVVGGQALVMAADRVIEKAKPVAAHMLEASADDIEFAAGAFAVRGTDSRKTLAEVVWETFTSHDLPEGVEPTLDAGATYDPVDFSFPHGTHLCAVEVDTETGQVALRSTSRSTTSASSSTRSSSRGRSTAASPKGSRRPSGRRRSTTSRARW